MIPTHHGNLLGGNSAVDDSHGEQPLPAPNQTPQSQGESAFADSSGQLFSMYSKIAEEEDDKMTERWQKDADGLLIFTGLFSASVATLLALTVQDLREDPQDISAFYLKNVYLLLAEPNVTRPSTTATPPPFSPPKYAIWVNSLWFMSLVISLTCAVLATSLHQWARRYIRITQPQRCNPEKRARMRAFFADGVDKLHIPWAVEGLPMLLHLSLFLFFGGLVVFLFNTNRAVSWPVTGLIALFTIVYACITLMPIYRYHSPYYAPLSTSAWWVYAGIYYIIFKLLASRSYGSHETRERFRDLRNHYRDWLSGGVEKAAEETASKQSSEIDIWILDWTISTLGEDDTLEKFFKALPGFFNSKLVNGLERQFSFTLYERFWNALDGFLLRTLASNTIIDSVKRRRQDICQNIMKVVLGSPPSFRPIIPLSNTLRDCWDRVPPSIETGQALALWCTNNDKHIAEHARQGIVWILGNVIEHDDSWIALAESQIALPQQVLRECVDHGNDSVSLAIFIHVAHQSINSGSWIGLLRWLLPQFDIVNTLPEIQHNFCVLWNQVVQEARDKGFYSDLVDILREIRHLYAALHEGTDTLLPVAASLATASDLYFNPFEPSSYPFCDNVSHRPGLTAHSPVITFPTPLLPTHPGDFPISLHQPTVFGPQPTPSSDLALQQTQQPNVFPGLPSSPTYPPPTHGLPFQSPTVDFPRIAIGFTSIANPSAPQRVETDVQVQNMPVPMDTDVPRHQHGPAGSAAAADIAQLDHPATHAHISGTSKTPDPAAGTSLTTNPIPTTITAFSGPHLPSPSVRDPADVLDVLPHAPIPQSITSNDAIPQRNDQTTVRVVPLTAISNFPPSPLPMSALRGDVIPAELPSSRGSDPIQPDPASHSRETPPSVTITNSPISPQVTPALDTQVISHIGASRLRDDTGDVNVLVPMAASLHRAQPGPQDPDITSSSAPAEDRQLGPK